MSGIVVGGHVRIRREAIAARYQQRWAAVTFEVLRYEGQLDGVQLVRIWPLEIEGPCSQVWRVDMLRAVQS